MASHIVTSPSPAILNPLGDMDLGDWVPRPCLRTRCTKGPGMAVCPALGLLVTSNTGVNTLSLFALPGGGAGAGGLTLLCTLGGPGSPPPMQFKFYDDRGFSSGWMAFTDHSGGFPPLLLVTAAGQDAVHVIDVVSRQHIGYVGVPGSIPGPRGVATKGSLAAVSSWKELLIGEHTVRLFEGAKSAWVYLRTIGGGFGAPGAADGLLQGPYGLRFTGDGSGVAVADRWNDRVSLFAVADGSFIKHLVTGLRCVFDVEECEGGWLVACAVSSTVEFVSGDGVGRATLGKYGSGDGEFKWPTALALVPGLGLVVRTNNGGFLQVFASPSMLAMEAMSDARVAWMAAVTRADSDVARFPLG